MSRSTSAAVVFALSLVLGGCAAEQYGQHGRERSAAPDTLALMTKEDVIDLSKAKVGDDVIISMLDASGSYFHLRTKDVVELADSGVSDKVISVMIKREGPRREMSGGGYYYYPPFYGYAMYPFWDPWYPSVYLGFSPWYYWPSYRPIYIGHAGFRGSGVRRFGVRRR
jgi:hypothetical protein